MTKHMQLRIAHLYPEIMNIYGDQGNITALCQRCAWRGIKATITQISLNQDFDPQKYDLIFGGGGQDRQQLLVANDLQKKKKAIKEAVGQGKVFLLICGTYQLFGRYFKTDENKKIPGIGVFDMITIASCQRKIGNVLVKLSDDVSTGNYQFPVPNLIGFENHSGNSFIDIDSETKHLAKVIKGFGNNGIDKTEGAVYKNVFGTYLHGPLLPKNPHFADYLIKTALETSYKKPVELKSLDDSLEWQAHQEAADLIK